ncbi:uncharacterized protein [Clytia hemisphaerica]|uniref:EGF-like domain-containing protein n=1 Tax=Clytia hemisphaerica TaxID=252671 RepID=A0A7M5XHX4_9CNID
MFSLLLLTLGIAINQIQSIPEECTIRGFENLVGSSQEHRILHFKPQESDIEVLRLRNVHDRTDDSQTFFEKNWFRFRIKNGSRMLEKKDLEPFFFARNETERASPEIFPCGTSFYTETIFRDNPDNIYKPGREAKLGKTSDFYVLNDEHPTQKYGLRLTSSIGCRYLRVKNDRKYDCKENGYVLPDPLWPGFEWPLYDCHFTLECNPSLTTEIAVRNCGDFFVYKTRQLPERPRVGKAGIYCGTDKPVQKVSEPQCHNYTVIKDETRRWSAISDLESVLNTTTCKDDSAFPQNTWIRFDKEIGNGTLRITNDCPSVSTNQTWLRTNSLCGALFRGWIKGEHPSVDEGRTTRTLCFSEATSCKCELSSQLEITNCGDFYVYRRRTRDFPHCFARACTEDERVEPSPSPSSSMSSSSLGMEMSMSSSMTSQMELSIMTSVSSSMLDGGMNKSSSIEMASSSMVPQGNITSSSSSHVVKNEEGSSTMMVNNSMSTSQVMMQPSSSESATPMLMMTSISSSVNTVVQMNISSSLQASSTRSLSMNLPETSSITPTMTTTSRPEKPLLNLCSNYETVTDDTRLSSLLPRCDLKYRPAIRFKDSNGQNLQIRENCTFKDQFDKKCTASSSYVWLSRKHPTGTDLQLIDICVKPASGPQALQVNFCDCKRKEFMYVQKCTDEEEPYFVYRLFPLFNSDGNALDAKKCSLRYCADVQPAKGPVIITTPLPTIAPEKAVFGVSGQFTIKKPFVNDAPLSQKDLDDKTSDTYKFLVQTMQDKIRDALKSLSKYVARIDITGFSIGSLVVDYKIYGTDTLNIETLNEGINKSFSDDPNLQTSTDTHSFSGTINPQSQQLNGLDLCEFEPCHDMANCTNIPQTNTFSCTCKEGLIGDGFTCLPPTTTTTTKAPQKEVDHQWSDGAIAAVSVMFILCFIVIVVLMCCLCWRSKKESHDTEFNKGSKGYSDYQETALPMKNKAGDDYDVIRNNATIEMNSNNESQKQF